MPACVLLAGLWNFGEVLDKSVVEERESCISALMLYVTQFVIFVGIEFMENGEPIKCEKIKADFDNGIGYCDYFKCRLHEYKPYNIRINTVK